MYSENANSILNFQDFKLWLKNECYSNKIISNYISRLRRLHKALMVASNNTIVIEEEFKKDKCASILKLFRNNGDNEDMRKLVGANLPIGKNHIICIKHSLKMYCLFLADRQKSLLS